jgi:hypothetical protein
MIWASCPRWRAPKTYTRSPRRSKSISSHDGNVLPVETEGRIRTRGVSAAEGYVHGRLDKEEVFPQEGSRLGDIDGTGPSLVHYSAHWRKDNDNPGFANPQIVERTLSLALRRLTLPLAFAKARSVAMNRAASAQPILPDPRLVARSHERADRRKRRGPDGDLLGIHSKLDRIVISNGAEL